MTSQQISRSGRHGGGANVTTANTVYGLGFLGALFYYLRTAESVLDGLAGFVQAVLWPAFLIYEALQRLGA